MYREAFAMGRWGVLWGVGCGWAELWAGAFAQDVVWLVLLWKTPKALKTAPSCPQ